MTGQYVFTDLCDGVIWSLVPVGDQAWIAQEWGYFGQRYTTFGQRSDGELVIGAYNNTIYQLDRFGVDE